MDEEDVKWIVENWDLIEDKYKESIRPYNDSEKLNEVKKEGHIVILLLDRQKPSSDMCYDFDEERIGINRFGQIIWGFDSGCSCPTPWIDNYPKCYKSNRTWKEFIINAKDFDSDFLEECNKKLTEIRGSLNVV